MSVKLEDLVSQDRIRPMSNGGGRSMSSLPLTVSQPLDQGKSLGGGQGGFEGSGGSQQAGPSEFIKKLYKMLEEESAMYGRGRAPGQPRGDGAKRGSVGWGRGGMSFVVWDMNDFTTKILYVLHACSSLALSILTNWYFFQAD